MGGGRLQSKLRFCVRVYIRRRCAMSMRNVAKIWRAIAISVTFDLCTKPLLEDQACEWPCFWSKMSEGTYVDTYMSLMLVGCGRNLNLIN